MVGREFICMSRRSRRHEGEADFFFFRIHDLGSGLEGELRKELSSLMVRLGGAMVWGGV